MTRTLGTVSLGQGKWGLSSVGKSPSSAGESYVSRILFHADGLCGTRLKVRIWVSENELGGMRSWWSKELEWGGSLDSTWHPQEGYWRVSDLSAP